jgi:uncharacterized protein YdeI (YjbR/CyaY-like superfamily)
VAPDLPELLVPEVAAWRAWLAEHHGDDAGVRLVLAKKGSLAQAVTGPTALTYAEALEEALCYGWIDGQVGRRDEATFFQRFTPRRARSVWSKNNVALAQRLTEEGRMQPAGLAAVDTAKQDGRLDAAYAGAATIEVPADLKTALEAEPRALAAFAGLNGQNRYAILYRLGTAKRPATRAARIDKFVAMLARGETIHPQGR